jgi:hypothetical protein
LLVRVWYCGLWCAAPNASGQRGGRWRYQYGALKHPPTIRQRMVGLDLAALDGDPGGSGIDPEDVSRLRQIHPSF